MMQHLRLDNQPLVARAKAESAPPARRRLVARLAAPARVGGASFSLSEVDSASNPLLPCLRSSSPLGPASPGLNLGASWLSTSGLPTARPRLFERLAAAGCATTVFTSSALASSRATSAGLAASSSLYFAIASSRFILFSAATEAMDLLVAAPHV